jgi:hypothetical protein
MLDAATVTQAAPAADAYWSIALDAINRVGFPTWVAVYLLVRMERKITELTDAIYRIAGISDTERRRVK